MRSFFLVCDFCAPYPGNFIAALKELRVKAGETSRFYYFLRRSSSSSFLRWYEKFSAENNCCLIDFDNSGAKLLAGLIDEKKPDAVCFHFGGFSFPFAVFKRCSIKSRRRSGFILQVHSNPSFNNSLLAKIKRTVSGFLCPSSFSFIACSSQVLKALQKRFRRSVVYFNPNGFDKKRLSFNAGKVIPKDCRNIVVFGYDYYIKGVDIAVSIAKALFERDHSFHLNIVVAKNSDEIRKKIADEHPDYHSFLSILNSNPNVSEIYKNASFYLLSSRTEGLPYSVLEASYSGLTVIASELPCLKTPCSIPHLYTFPVGDIDKAVSLLETCSKAPPIEAKESDFDAFSLEKWAHEELLILERIVDERS